MLYLARIASLVFGIVLLPFVLCSQSVELTYTVFSGVNTAPDTVRIYAQSMNQQAVGIRALNISLVFDGDKSNFLSYYSHLSTPWTSTFERDLVDSVAQTYWGNSYQRRWNYGIGDALVTPSSLVMIPPDTTAPLMILELRFQQLGSSLIYVEDQTENPVNQIGDASFNQLFYQVRPLPGTFPVVWASFSADEDVEDGVLLTWETASEVNNDFFIIESSTNQDFSLVEELGKREGKGTTTTSQRYTFLDERVGEGKRYYRIRQVDIDGAFSYSNIIDVLVEGSVFQIRLNQTLSDGQLNIRILGVPESGLVLSLINTSGQTLWTERPNTAGRRNLNISLSTEQFSKGVLFLKARPVSLGIVERVKSFILQ